MYCALVSGCDTFFFFTLKYANVSFKFFFALSRAFGWIRLLPTIIVVYATKVQVNAF